MVFCMIWLEIIAILLKESFRNNRNPINKQKIDYSSFSLIEYLLFFNIVITLCTNETLLTKFALWRYSSNGYTTYY